MTAPPEPSDRRESEPSPIAPTLEGTMRYRRKAVVRVAGAAGAGLLGLALTATLMVNQPGPAAATPGDGQPGARDTIVHLFQWPWNSVASECANVLGPKGFGAVQVSPPQEHVVLGSRGYPWWQDYQPVSYSLAGTRRGDRAAFAAMVSRCHAAGVKVYVDAIVNHMAGGASAGTTGSAGSAFTQYTYPSVPYGTGDFHHCGRNGNDDIVNWSDRWEIQNCELVDLSDLRTEADYVRGKVGAYLADLRSLGVDGFRVDAAKHVPVADLQNIYARAGGGYIFQEVSEGGTGEPRPTEYTGIGDVTEFRYGNVVGGAFAGGNLSGLQNLAGQMLLNSEDATAFIDNHDTQRDGRARLNYKSGAPYAMAEAFMLAYPYGSPQVMSSFAFGSQDQGPPATSDGTTQQVSCGSAWVCEHRWRTTANLVGFRNETSGTGVTDWWSNGSGQIAFGRGARGYVVFNREGALTRTFQTGLPAGTYCDVANGDVSGTACSGTAYPVDAAGRFTATVPADGVLALHTGARVSGGSTPPTGCSAVSTTFRVNATTSFGQDVFVVGSVAALGSWNPANAVPMSSAAYPVWEGSVSLPANSAVQYKYIKKQGSAVIWESDPNRSATTSATVCSATLDDSWR